MTWNREAKSIEATRLLKSLLQAMGMAQVAEYFEFEVQDDDWVTINLYSGMLFLDVGIKFEVNTSTVRGYRVGHYKTIPGSRWVPDDVVATTVLETQHVAEAVEQIGRLIVADLMLGITESRQGL